MTLTLSYFILDSSCVRGIARVFIIEGSFTINPVISIHINQMTNNYDAVYYAYVYTSESASNLIRTLSLL